MKDKLSELLFKFIVKKGLRSEWDKFFEANQPDPDELCPHCVGSGEIVFGGSFGGPTTHTTCLTCKGTGLKPTDDEKSN
jgi:DnaJ-class molecular chaperone